MVSSDLVQQVIKFGLLIFGLAVIKASFLQHARRLRGA